mgnify:CR=1 FL=1
MVKPLSTKYPSKTAKSLKRKTQHAKKKMLTSRHFLRFLHLTETFLLHFLWHFFNYQTDKILTPFFEHTTKPHSLTQKEGNHRMKIVGKSLDYDSDSMASKATLEGSKTSCSDSDTQIRLPICNYSIFFLIFY